MACCCSSPCASVAVIGDVREKVIVHGGSALSFYYAPVITSDVDVIVDEKMDKCRKEECTVHGHVCSKTIKGVSVDFLYSKRLYNSILRNKWFVELNGFRVVIPEYIVVEKLLKIISFLDHLNKTLMYIRSFVPKQFVDLYIAKKLVKSVDKICDIAKCCFEDVLNGARLIVASDEMWIGGGFVYYMFGVDLDEVKREFIELYDWLRWCG